MLFRLAEILTDQEILFPPIAYDLPSPIVYSNEADFDPKWAAYVLAHPYKARTAHCDALILGKLPNDATLIGGHHFLLQFGDKVAAESVPHAMRLDASLLTQELQKPRLPVVIDEECVLLTRYGHGTWGHWLAEILPIAAIIERRYPGRFKFAVPDHGDTAYGAVMVDSLYAYGVDAGRLIRVAPGQAYCFPKALMMTPVWSDYTPHPAALDVMRGAVRLSFHQPGRDKIALMRRDSWTRAISNGAEVEECLRAEGFIITDAASLPFLDQVRMFQSARTVFCVLGSGLTGLVYSPNHVRVLAAGPATWGDRFFYTLAQHRCGRWAEVRGRSLWDGQGMMRDAPFEIPVLALHEALNKLEMV